MKACLLGKILEKVEKQCSSPLRSYENKIYKYVKFEHALKTLVAHLCISSHKREIGQHIGVGRGGARGGGARPPPQ